MSYLFFLLLFLLPPIGALLLLLRGQLDRLMGVALALTALIALLYTAPWDNAIILNGVWSYTPAHVLNLVLGVVPLEEYIFYILQVLMTGLFTLWLLRRRQLDKV